MTAVAALLVGLAGTLFAACVLCPLAAGARLFALDAPVPEGFGGMATLGPTLGWSAACAALACALGWPVGRAMRSGRGGQVLRALSVVSAALPPYAVFWTWWQASGPGSMLGDWAARSGHNGALREAILVVGVSSWAWPLAAWLVAGHRDDGEADERAAGAVDAEGGWDAVRRAWRTDRAALAMAFVALVLFVAGSTTAFDLAQVKTYGFELRTLDVQGTPAAAVMRAAWPCVLLALAAGVGSMLLPIRPRIEGDPSAARRPARLAWTVAMVTLVVPVAMLAWTTVARGALDRFAELSLRGAAGTLLAAAAAGALLAAVAAAHLVLAARGRGPGPSARAARVAEGTMLVGWSIAAAVPATVAALCVIAAFNDEVLGPLVYDTPAVVVVTHVGRFGVVAAWIGRLAALREPRERADLRALEGASLGSSLAALVPDVRGAAVASALVCTVLAAGEVVAAARVEPPGWAWASSSLLNAIHYQQPSTVLGGLLAIVLLAGAAGAMVAIVLGRGERLRGMTILLLAAVVVGGCREQPSAPEGTSLEVERWFGSPGRGRAQFEYPRALDIDPRDGTVVVVDRQARLQRFTPDGEYVAEWAMPEKALGKPTGLGIGPDGRVWVADTHYHRVICWSPDGKELLRFGEYGTGPGQFIFPCDAEVGPDGNVWVAEFGGNDRIQVFTPEGTFVRSFGGPGRGPGQFDRPQSMVFSAEGRELFVADACNHRIQVLDLDGRFLRAYGRGTAVPVDFAFPYGIDRCPDGSLLVTEFGNHRLHRVRAADGADLGTVRSVANAPVPLLLHVVDGDRVKSVPSGENALRFPWAVGVREGRAFILDSGHSRILRVPIEGLGTAVSGPRGQAAPAAAPGPPTVG